MSPFAAMTLAIFDQLDEDIAGLVGARHDLADAGPATWRMAEATFFVRRELVRLTVGLARGAWAFLTTDEQHDVLRARGACAANDIHGDRA